MGDLRVGKQRHLIFATPFLTEELTVVKDPFKPPGQLLSIHSFILQDGRRKHLPLALVLMSRKMEEDYVAVLQALVNDLEETSVEEFMVDYEVDKLIQLKNL